MPQKARRSTIYLDAELHRALRVKAAHTQRTISELVNEAVKEVLREDREDLESFEERAHEETMSYEDLLTDLKSRGKL